MTRYRWKNSGGYGWPIEIHLGGSGKGGPTQNDWPGGFFGPGGSFGPHGIFGPDGPFGPRGPFGSAGDARRRSYPGRRRGRMFAAGELRLLLLSLIGDQPRHGYELIKAIEEMTAQGYSPSPGTIYPTLALLEDEGLIREVPGDEEPRKAYEVTERGRAELAENAEEVARVRERLEQQAGHTERQAETGRAFATPEMFRALGNLANVLKNKMRAGEIDKAKIGQFVDLVDDLARKIERL